MQKSLLTFFLSIVISGSLVAQMRQLFIDTSNINTNNDIRKISFYSSNEGYIAFRDWVGFTADTGRTFVKKFITNTNVDFNGYNVNSLFGFLINGVKAFNRDTLIVYGAYDNGTPSILYSTNQGLSYKLIFYNAVNASSSGITDMVFPENSNRGFAVDADRILSTTNRGKTWYQLSYQPGKGLDYIDGVSDNYVYVHGSHILLGVNVSLNMVNNATLPPGYIIASHFQFPWKGWINMLDGSVIKAYLYNNGNWFLMSNPSVSTPFAGAMHFVNDSTGYGIGGVYNIYKTTDSGRHWERVPRTNEFNYAGYSHNVLQFLPGNNYLAGGDFGFLEINTNQAGATIPSAFFTVDTTNVFDTGNVKLTSLSKPTNNHRWYKDDTLIGSTNIFTYHHYTYDSSDTIKLIVSNGVYSDTFQIIQQFTVPPPPPIPVISSFTPLETTTGDEVTITGANFENITSVYFGSTPAASFNVVSTSSIKAIVRNGSTGSVVVTNIYGTSSLAGFVYASVPKIISVMPGSAPAGSSVIIRGNYFGVSTSANAVFFGKVKANILSASDTQLLVTVPAGANYKPVSVTTGNRTAYSPKDFCVTFPGAVNSIQNDAFELVDRQVLYPGSNCLSTITSADMDGDGKADLVGTCTYLNKISIYRNTCANGIVSFAPPVFLVPGMARSGGNVNVTFADMNGDGKLDLLQSTDGQDDLGVYLNTSTPGYVSFTERKFINSDIPFLATGFDFNADGKPDIAGAGLNYFLVYKNLSSPPAVSFERMVLYAANSGFGDAKDMDNDGKPDIINTVFDNSYGTYAGVYKNNSNFQSLAFAGGIIESYMPGLQSGIATADFDGDGKFDIFCNTLLNDSAGFAVRRNITAASGFVFEPIRYFNNKTIGQPWRTIETGDMDGDGKPDVVIPNIYNTSFSIFKNISSPGNINFANNVDFDDSMGTLKSVDVEIMDFDGDGKNDIVALKANGDTVNFFRNRIGEPSVLKMCPPTASRTLTTGLTSGSYQWQVNNGNGFQNIVAGTNYVGVNTNTLTLLNIPSSWYGYTYRCSLDGNYSSETKVTFANVWTGAIDTAWENPNNWSCGHVPDSNTDVIITTGTLVVNSNVVCRTLKIGPAATVTVNTGFNLSITHY